MHICVNVCICAFRCSDLFQRNQRKVLIVDLLSWNAYEVESSKQCRWLERNKVVFKVLQSNAIAVLEQRK